MSILERLKGEFQRFMSGRHGADELSLALLIAGVILSILTSLTGFAPLYLLGLVAYGFSIFRLFSRNIGKRYAENSRFLALWHGWRSSINQFINRIKNMRKFKYFKCPQCHARLRLPRDVGEVTVTCGNCHHAFRQKA